VIVVFPALFPWKIGRVERAIFVNPKELVLIRLAMCSGYLSILSSSSQVIVFGNKGAR
jgi:hypothetical protein